MKTLHLRALVGLLLAATRKVHCAVASHAAVAAQESAQQHGQDGAVATHAPAASQHNPQHGLQPSPQHNPLRPPRLA